jgi:hypothetical protein
MATHGRGIDLVEISSESRVADHACVLQEFVSPNPEQVRIASSGVPPVIRRNAADFGIEPTWQGVQLRVSGAQNRAEVLSTGSSPPSGRSVSGPDGTRYYHLVSTLA